MSNGGQAFVVLGDVSLDRYSFGVATGLSPEAPVPLVEVKRESYMPGNSSNAAIQLAALGARVVEVTVVGDDPEGDHVLKSLKEAGVERTFAVRHGATPVVHRVMAGRHQLLMMKRTPEVKLRGRKRQELLSGLMEALRGAAGLLISDHTGALTDVIGEAIRIARGAGAKVVVNAYSFNAFEANGADMIRISMEEASRATGITAINETSVRNMGMDIISRTGAGSVLIAWVDEGAHLVEGSSYSFIQPVNMQPSEFTGMGDVMAALALYGLSSGLDRASAARLAYAGAARYASRGGRRYITREELGEVMEVAGVGGGT